MVFNGSQPLSVNDPLDRMVGNGFWRDIHWTQWNGMIFICSQPLAKWSFGNQPSLRGSWHYGRHWHGTLPDLLSRWSTRKVVDEKTEDDFLSTNSEKFQDNLIRLPWRYGCQMGGVGILGPSFLDLRCSNLCLLSSVWLFLKYITANPVQRLPKQLSMNKNLVSFYCGICGKYDHRIVEGQLFLLIFANWIAFDCEEQQFQQNN